MTESPSIAMCCNVYNDVSPLRGLLETSARFFDELFIVHSGPCGARSNDGTIELCESFGCRIVFDDIQKGFGVIRSRLIHEHGCEWGMILDADERFFPMSPELDCSPDLIASPRPLPCHQGDTLRRIIADPRAMAIRTTRRHWHDFSMTRPTQNWFENCDHQLRIVRNVPEIAYQSDRVMHERLIDSRTGHDPVFYEQDDYLGPFHDHFHMYFRNTEPGKKEANEINYSRLERGETMLP
jgi:hypothetical protein